MFVGHYGPAGAAAGRTLKLWHCFIAVQFLDILWAPFVLAGIEHLRIVPHFTASNHLDLYHMPVTHSLPMAAFWSLFAALAYRLLRPKAGAGGAAVIGLLVFSHWVLDFLAHKPDLLLYFGGPKVGLGLWDNRPLSFGVEMALFYGGLAVYLLRTDTKIVLGRIAPLLLALLALGAQIIANWGPPPEGPEEAAMTAIIAYAVFTALALFVDLTRVPKRA
ncbi:MAG TPA: hypothetical protein PLV61_16075 [Parvularculaceae bacterium]|nr:hypothetical protein [Parvularculaceae bacterium]HRX40740.1 hypothetical protein [Parvularculaceae bacterium]